jgi:hypothetical protein
MNLNTRTLIPAGATASLCTLSVFGAVESSSLPSPATKKIDFGQDISLIFERSCLRCHGPEKPKSRFRLDSREAALKGGAHGVDILPGDSANSPLIQIVAGLHPEIERMPPEGKGTPLTAQEISSLRAWIDQGAPWSTNATPLAPQPVASAAPALRWIDVSGDNQRFREHFWAKDGFQAGLESFSLRDRLTPDSGLTVQGRIFPGEEDFRISLRYERADVGFIDVGVDQYRKYYDNSGGFYPFSQPIFSLDRELSLRNGRAWADFGLTLPDWPKIALGYEYQFRQGTKSTLQWGSVEGTPGPQRPATSIEKKIYPAYKDIDESVHILKLDISHEFDGFFAEDNFRAEFYDLKTSRQNVLSITEGQTAPTSSTLIDERHNEFRAVNAFRLEKEVRPWWFVSAGYLYSKADADATFRQNTLHESGLPISGDFWRSHAIVLSQDSVLMNANTLLGPWQNLTLSAGIQSEYMHQEGMGRVSLDTGNPATLLLLQPATLDANLERNTLREMADLHFTGIPFTTLFANARLEQEAFGNFEDQIGAGHAFRRDTDSDGDLKDWRVGFYTSPLRTVSIGAHYRERHKHTDYDDRIDTTPDYPAFIRDRTVDTDEVEAKLTWRPRRWLKTTLTYQWVETDFRSATDPIAGTTPGGSLRGGTFNANVYGMNLILTPLPRWYFSGTFNYYDSRATSAQNDVPSVVPYRGDVYSVLANATYIWNTNTDLTVTYTFSRADYAQHNVTAGLPLGINYDWHTVQAGITRRFKNATFNLQYGFYKYGEPTSGGFNDYTAHAIFAALTLHGL